MADRETGGSILVGGAINTDLVAEAPRAPLEGETITGSSFAIYGGGKGANQAVAAARSGGRVSLIGGLGDDDFARQRRKDLAADGIRMDYVQTVAEQSSGVALITIEPDGQNRIVYVPGATGGVGVEGAVAAFEAERPRILLTTLELPIGVLTALFERARSSGTVTLLNATPEPASAHDLLAMTDVLIVNEVEARELAGDVDGGEGWDGVAQVLRSKGVQSVVITLGAEGCLVVNGAGSRAIPTRQVTAVDTTGAGDTFCGAIAAALAAGRGLVKACEIGAAAATISVTRAGAQPSIPFRQEINAWLGQA